MFGLSLGHIIILLVIAMIFGPKRLTVMAEQLGKSLRGVRQSLDDVKETTGVNKVADSWNSMQSEVNKMKNPMHYLEDDKKPDSEKKS